ncbi:MAG: MBL fold metallo-hydrolase [Calditrichaeota bacterium]|nr:MBL fold metallo-hydrolase [Calditrichota bacterium]
MIQSGKLQIHTVVVGPFSVNCYLVHPQNRPETAIIDPGGDEDLIFMEIQNLRLTPRLILLTHGHIDHLLAVQALKHRFQIPVLANENEKEFLANLALQGQLLGLSSPPGFEVDRWVSEPEEIALGPIHLKVIDTPGHTPGSCSYVGPGEVFVGDTLFAGSIGRTDLPGGDYQTLIDSVKNKLFVLPDDFDVFPGHGPRTTIRNEKRFNPFVRGNS